MAASSAVAANNNNNNNNNGGSGSAMTGNAVRVSVNSSSNNPGHLNMITSSSALPSNGSLLAPANLSASSMMGVGGVGGSGTGGVVFSSSSHSSLTSSSATGTVSAMGLLSGANSRPLLNPPTAIAYQNNFQVSVAWDLN